MKRKKHSVLSYLVRREYGQPSRGDGRDVGHLFAEDKASDPAINEPCGLSGSARSTFVMVFSPDGKKVASTHGDHTVRVSDIATGKCLNVLKGHPRTPWTVAFHPSSSDILASGCLAGDVRIWDLKGGGSELWKVPNGTVVASMAFHPSDQLLVIASANVVYFWDWNLPEPIVSRSTNNDYEQIRWVKFDPLGHHLFTGIANGSTVQREDSVHHMSHFGYMNDGPYMDPHRAGLRRQYYDLVSRYNQHQMDEVGFRHIHTSSGRTSTTPSGSTYTQSSTRSSPLDIDLDEPTSPTNLTALDDARQYASIVTNLSNMPNASPSAGDIRNRRPSDSFSPRSNAEENTHTVSSLSSRPLYRGRWRYVSREAAASSRLSGISRNQNGVRGGWPRLRDRSMPDPLQRFMDREIARRGRSVGDPSQNVVRPLVHVSSTRTVASSAGTGSSAQREDRTANDSKDTSKSSESVETSRNKDTSKTSESVETSRNKDTSKSSESVETSRNKDTSKSSESVETSRNSILFSHLSSTEPPSSQSSSSSTTTSAQPSKPTQVPSSSDSGASNTGDQIRPNRPRISLLRSWLKSSKHQVPPRLWEPIGSTNSNKPSTSSSTTPSPAQDANRNTARSVTVIRPSTVDLPRILDSQQDLSRVRSSEDLESRARARVLGSGATGSGSMYCERCQNSRNLVLQDNLPRRMTPPRRMYRTPGACSQTDVGCETEDNTNSSLHRSVGTETNKASNRGEDKRTISDSKPFAKIAKLRPFSKRFNFSRESCAGSAGGTPPAQDDSGEPPRKRFKSDTSDSRNDSHSEVSSNSKNDSDKQVKSDPVEMKSESEKQSKSDSDHTASCDRFQSRRNQRGPSDRFTDVSPSTSRLACTQDAACSSSSDHIQSQSDLGSDSRGHTSRSGLFATSASNLDEHSREREIPRCSLPNCSQFQGFRASRDNSDPAESGSRLHSHLSRRYHRLQDFRRRILDIHDRLQQRRRHRSIQDRLWPQRAQRCASFTDRMEALRQERLRADRNLRQRVDRGNLPQAGPYVIPDITITRPPDSPPVSELEHEDDHDDRQEILRDLDNIRMEAMRARNAIQQEERVLQQRQAAHGRTWHQLQRRYLHPHYSVGILDETINQPNDSIQTAINRAIAGVYLGNGETAVANNIVDKTYRIQRWYFDVLDIPFIDKADVNIVVPHCKLHNDTSAEISQDGHLLATFVPSQRGFPDDTILAVYSLEPDTLGQCWYTKGFGPNAISVSISPLNQYVLVGLAARRLAWVFSQSQQVAQVYSLCNKEEGELSMKHVTDIMHPCDSVARNHHISVNSAKWLPGPGEGIIYGTNRGDLNICRAGKKGPHTSRGDETSNTASSSSSGLHNLPSQNLRRNLMEMLGITVPRTISTATQTPPGPQRTTSTTQTIVLGSDDSSSESE